MKIKNYTSFNSREFTREEWELFCELAVEQGYTKDERLEYHQNNYAPLFGVHDGELKWSPWIFGWAYYQSKNITAEFRKWLDEQNKPELPEDFTRHTGGTMPEGLHPKDEVRVVLMGVPHEPFIGLAGSCGWAQAGDSTIIGYKVTKKHVAAATQPDPSYPTDLSEITPLQAANAVMYNGKQVRLTQDEAAKMLVYLIELRGDCTGSGE